MYLQKFGFGWKQADNRWSEGAMMGRAGCALGLLAVATTALPALACEPTQDSLKTSRIIQIDASNGPIYGQITRFTREPDFLKPKEVVLTFDDGPSQRITRSILDTLDKFCVKATFFPVGRMAIANPRLTPKSSILQVMEALTV